MILKTILILVALTLSYQDFKNRAVNLLLLLGFGVLSIAVFFVDKGSWIDLTLNIAYIIILFLFTGLAAMITMGKKVSNMIGLADILFLLFLAPLFDFDSFIIWTMIMLVASLIAHIIFDKLDLIKNPSVPLVTYMAVFFCGTLIYQLF